MPDPDRFTQLLSKARGGDRSVLDRIVAQVHEELHGIAEAHAQRERSDHTLHPTALVNEAYLRLVDQRNVDWKSRTHFLAIASKQMFRVLADHARARGAAKRGGGAYRVTLHDSNMPDGDTSMCRETLREVGLTIPTEAQSEFAARGGTTTPWSCGAEKAGLEGYANLADEFSKNFGGAPGFGSVEWNDGYTAHAPVGTYKPNPYGLYDVHGNVWEWCRESRVSYDVDPREGDGFRLGTEDSVHMSRGGSFYDTEPFARSTMRVPYGTDGQDATLGVRPSKSIQRSKQP